MVEKEKGNGDEGLKTQKGTWWGTRKTHWTDTLVINSCLCSGSIYYAVILAALPRDTPQNEISSPQTPDIWIGLFQLPLTHYCVYVWLCTCVWASIVSMCHTDTVNLLYAVQVLQNKKGGNCIESLLIVQGT